MRSLHSLHRTTLAILVSSVLLAGLLAGCGGAASDNGSADQKQETSSSGDVTENGDAAASDSEMAAVTTVEIGETRSNEDFDITFEEAYWDRTDDRGYWKYYDESGSTSSVGGMTANADVFAIRAKVTNKYTSGIKALWQYSGKALVNEKYEYDVKVQTTSTNNYEIVPLETKDIWIYIPLPEGTKGQIENIKIDFGLDPRAESFPLKEGTYEVFELNFEF